MAIAAPVELAFASTVVALRAQIAKLRASLEECVAEEAGLYWLGLEAAMSDSYSDEEEKFIDIADGIEERARAALAETETS